MVLRSASEHVPPQPSSWPHWSPEQEGIQGGGSEMVGGVGVVVVVDVPVTVPPVPVSVPVPVPVPPVPVSVPVSVPVPVPVSPVPVSVPPPPSSPYCAYVTMAVNNKVITSRIIK